MLNFIKQHIETALNIDCFANLYAKNVFNFVSNLYDKENKKLNINLEDEIIEKTLIRWYY